MNERLFINLKELADSGYIFRITDNGGATLDRITVIFCDRGPYLTTRQALAATLPDDYSLSGPEYHSSLDVSRLKPTAGVKAKLRRLEKKAA